jgi:hypothetical protein
LNIIILLKEKRREEHKMLRETKFLENRFMNEIELNSRKSIKGKYSI